MTQSLGYDGWRWYMHPNGQRLHKARSVIARYIDALRYGYAKNFLPEPGASLDQEYVEDAVAIIDAEWNHELYRREGRSLSSLNLSGELALVGELRQALDRDLPATPMSDGDSAVSGEVWDRFLANLNYQPHTGENGER